MEKKKRVTLTSEQLRVVRGLVGQAADRARSCSQVLYDRWLERLLFDLDEAEAVEEPVAVGPMTASERAELRDLVFEQLRGSLFGDGREDGYVRDGFPPFGGVNNLSDAGLLRELGHFDPRTDTTYELRLAAWRRERERAGVAR